MDRSSDRPVRVNSGNSFVVPMIAAVAIAIALVFGWGMMANKSTEQAAHPVIQSSSDGVGSGESGKSTVQNDQDMRSNPGAGAAPTKAPNTNPNAADTQPKP